MQDEVKANSSVPKLGAWVFNGVIAEGTADMLQCLNNGQVVSVTVTEVNGQPVSIPASGSPKTASGTAGEILSFTVTATAPPTNWRLDSKTCNDTLFDQVYTVLIDGQAVYTSPPIHPGDSFVFNYSDPQKKAIQPVRYTVTPDGERTNPEYSRTIGTGDPLWYQDGSAPVTTSARMGRSASRLQTWARARCHTRTRRTWRRKTLAGKSVMPFTTNRAGGPEHGRRTPGHLRQTERHPKRNPFRIPERQRESDQRQKRRRCSQRQRRRRANSPRCA